MTHWTLKPWGKLLILPSVVENGETHILTINKGGQSSIHSHKEKRNLFHVICGRLRVVLVLYDKGKTKYEPHVLGEGETYIVESGVEHCFIAEKPTVCIEQYWVTDIHRRQAF